MSLPFSQLVMQFLLAGLLACRGMAADSKEDIFDFKHLVAREPFAQFKAWFDEATKHEKVTTEGFEDELEV